MLSCLNEHSSANEGSGATEGLGYVRHGELAPNLSVIGVFHQLHCLVGPGLPQP